MDTSEINNDARFADDDNSNNNDDDNNMGSINSTHTYIYMHTDHNCKSLPTCVHLSLLLLWCKENENGLSKSFISFIQSKRKQQQEDERRAYEKQSG